MKKFVTLLLLVLSILSSISAAAFAADNRNKKWVESEGYKFKITESVDTKNRVTRTFERNVGSIQVQNTLFPDSQTKISIV